MSEDVLEKAARRVRVGIDVGGTFTDVVVIDHETREVVAQLKVPTTHQAREGVALGIINAIERALTELNIAPDEVTFIAHSTTQATNALLEGDVARVGVIGLGRGLEALKARVDTRVPALALAPGRDLKAEHRFVKFKDHPVEGVIVDAVNELRAGGVQVVVASEAFGVDSPDNENKVAAFARAQGLMSTTGHEVSSLYGLRTRTRTAVLNAAILPKMVATAEMTAACVERAGITAPLMIMRSDGGVMSVAEVHRRPIMTMLSGPAAGIAGALMHERVSDGIFIEVGGTSADISVIRDGQPQTRPARVGGHRTFLNTLDVRTLAIAGGSMVREADNQIIDVGPRSAHIANLPYAAFARGETFDGAQLIHLRPTGHDANDYVAVETARGARYALTPTCAANALEVIPDSSFAKGDAAAARAAFAPLAAQLRTGVAEAARLVLDVSCRKVARQIEELIEEYRLDRQTVELVGGGGGAASLIPHTARMMNLASRLARQAEVISTIGVALAMVRDRIERNIVEPTPADILQVRREAAEAVIKAGAVPESIEVQVEVDSRRNLVTATAFGTTELKRKGGEGDADAGRDALAVAREAAARSMRANADEVRLAGETSGLYAFVARHITRAFFNLFKTEKQAVRVTDRTGVVRLQRKHAEVVSSTVAHHARDLEIIITKLTDFGDAGRALPDVHVLVGARIINLSGLADVEQALVLSAAELDALPPEELIVIVAAPKGL